MVTICIGVKFYDITQEEYLSIISDQWVVFDPFHVIEDRPGMFDVERRLFIFTTLELIKINEENSVNEWVVFFEKRSFLKEHFESFNISTNCCSRFQWPLRVDFFLNYHEKLMNCANVVIFIGLWDMDSRSNCVMFSSALSDNHPLFKTLHPLQFTAISPASVISSWPAKMISFASGKREKSFFDL